MKNNTPTIWRWIAWAQVTLATFGSLALTLVWHLPACILCYYQRVMMFTLFIVLTSDLIKSRQKFWKISLPITVTGGLIALYHTLIQANIVYEYSLICAANTISCSERYGFNGPLTIPLISFIAFIVIFICLILDRQKSQFK